MDIIKPDFIVVDGRCFRSFYSPSNAASFYSRLEDDEEENVVGEPLDCLANSNDEEEIVINQESDSSFVHSMIVPPQLYGLIIGAKGETLHKLETATRCRIIIPRKGDDTILGKTVFIKSAVKKNIYSARRKIMAIIERYRIKLQPTHFISIPITDEMITTRFNEFKFSVLKDRDREPHLFHNICEEIFQDPHQFHLTICMLIILDGFDEEEKVIDILKKLTAEKIKPLIGDKKLSVEIKGLEYMNDDIKAVDILYGKVHPNDPVFQQMGDLLADEFKNTSFISRERSKVIYHLTLLNSKFKLYRQGIHYHPKEDPREQFDVEELISRYGDYYFGDAEIDRIELLIRKTSAETGRYTSLFEINLKN